MSSLSKLGTGALSNSALRSSISKGTDESNNSFTLVLDFPERIDIINISLARKLTRDLYA